MVKHGRREASAQLAEDVHWFLEDARRDPYHEQRKAYTWRAGRDERKHKQKSVSIQELLNRVQQVQATLPQVRPSEASTAKPIEPPKDEPTDKLQGRELTLFLQGRLCGKCRAQVRTQHVKVADRQWEKLCPTCAASISQPALPQPARSQATQPYVPPQPMSKPQLQRCRGCQSTERPVRWFPVDGGIWLCQYCVVPRWLKWENGKKRAG